MRHPISTALATALLTTFALAQGVERRNRRELLEFEALGASSSALVQDPPGSNEPGGQETGAQEEATQGLLPVPDYSGDWQTRPFLTGDWGGLRQDWANKGLTFDFEWSQVGQGVVSGGIDERGEYGSNLDYSVKFDLMRMGVLPGALVSFRGQSRFGDTVNADTGLLLPVNSYSFFPLTDPIDEDVPFAVTELNYAQFLSEEFGLLLGKVTTMANANEFAGGEGRSQFMNYQFISPAVFAHAIPYSAPAAGAVWLPRPDVNLTSLLINTLDSSTTVGLDDIDRGTSWWTSVDVQYDVGSKPGGTRVGGLYGFNGDFARRGGIIIDPGGAITIGTQSETWAFYVDSWQYLWTEDEPKGLLAAEDGRQDLQGVGVFAKLAFGDKATNPVRFSFTAGLSGRGPIPGRDDDTWGAGYFYNEVLEPRVALPTNLLADSSQGAEVYYNVAIARSIALTLDFQWAESAFRQVDDAFLLGARLVISF